MMVFELLVGIVTNLSWLLSLLFVVSKLKAIGENGGMKINEDVVEKS